MTPTSRARVLDVRVRQFPELFGFAKHVQFSKVLIIDHVVTNCIMRITLNIVRLVA